MSSGPSGSGPEAHAGSPEALSETERLQRHVRQLELQVERLSASRGTEPSSHERLTEEVREAKERKAALLASMSHELRTPLNSLLLFADMLAENEERNLTEGQIEAAKLIHSCAFELLTLVNDILDLSRAEAGQLAVTAEDVAVTTLMQDLQTHFAADVQRMDVRLRTDSSGQSLLILRSDPQRLKQILRNVVAAALRAHGLSSVSVEARPAPSNAVFRDRTLARRDPIGLRVTLSGARFDTGATHLNLVLAQELAKSIGAELQVENGAESAVLYVPLTDHKDMLLDSFQPRPLEDAVFLGIIARKKILVVDDNGISLTALRGVLASSGVEVLTAKNGQQALDTLATQNDIDVVVMDMVMPLLDGYEATRRIRAQPRFANLPIVALTASANPGDKLKCLEAGATRYLPKPVSKSMLIGVLSELLTVRH